MSQVYVREEDQCEEEGIKVRTKNTEILDLRSDPKVNQMRVQVEAMCQRSTAVQITSQRTYDQAVAQRDALKTMLQNIDDLFEPMRKSTNDAHQSVLSTKSSLHDPVDRAIKKRSTDIIEWEEQKERERLEEEQRLEAEVHKKAERQRKSLVTRARNRGDDEEADALEDAPLDVAPVEVQATYKKNSAVIRRTTYKGEVTDFFELVKFVAKNKHFIHLLEANMREVHKLANSQQSALAVPGLRAVPSTTLASVSRRGEDD